MWDKAKRAAQKVGYALLSITVALREAWLRWTTSFRDTWQGARRKLPALESFFQRLRGLRGSCKLPQRGSLPRPPRILGAVLAHSHEGPQDDQAICRLLRWARLTGFRLVVLYDPAGEFQKRRGLLVEALRWGDPDGRSTVVWSGWVPPAEWVEAGGKLAFTAAVDDSIDESQQNGPMGVALLSAADAELPLTAAAAAVSNSNSKRSSGGSNALAEAVAAGEDVKARLVEVAGPLAGAEPDLVVIFGSTLMTAGFPPWALRTAELFEVGQLAALTGGKMDAVVRRFKGTRQRFGR